MGSDNATVEILRVHRQEARMTPAKRRRHKTDRVRNRVKMGKNG